MSKVRKDDTEETREFWEFVDKTSEEVKSWPEWKKSAKTVLVKSPPAVAADGGEAVVLQRGEGRGGGRGRRYVLQSLA